MIALKRADDKVLVAYVVTEPGEVMDETALERCQLSGRLEHTQVKLIKAGKRSDSPEPDKTRAVKSSFDAQDNNISAFVQREITVILRQDRDHTSIMQDGGPIEQLIAARNRPAHD